MVASPKKLSALACAAGWVVSCLCSVLASSAIAQTQVQALPAASGPMMAASRPAPARTAASARSSAKQPTKPLWSELTQPQQQALAPLAPKWDTVSETQKRKWLALSRNFPKMSGDEQGKLHSRMAEWVALSPQQRTEARLNFGETRQLAPDDKKAKWEAYQALPPEQKDKLAAGAAKPPATAAALRPVPAAKLAVVPQPTPSNPQSTQNAQSKNARITVPPNQVDHNTLLPQRAPASPAVPIK